MNSNTTITRLCREFEKKGLSYQRWWLNIYNTEFEYQRSHQRFEEEMTYESREQRVSPQYSHIPQISSAHTLSLRQNMTV